MHISSSKASQYYRMAQHANVNQIKSLNQTERKALKAMLGALKLNQPGADSDAITEKTLDSLSHKLKIKVIKEPSPLITRIIKGVMNFFGLRVSSRKLQSEISQVKEKPVQQKIKQIKGLLEREKRAFTKSPDQDYNKGWVEDRQVEKKHLTGDNVSKSGHLVDFKSDYERLGHVLTVDDPLRGTFQGYSGMKDDTTEKEDRYQFHAEGMDRIFIGTVEKEWMRLAEATSQQGNLAAMSAHELNVLMADPGLQVADENYTLDVTQLNNASRYFQVEVVRGAGGQIQRLDVNITRHVPVKASSEDAEPITLGYITSRLSYSVAFAEDGETPEVTGIKYDNSYSAEKPLPPEAKEPGFHPANPPQDKGKADVVTLWNRDLSKMKLDLRPTSAKIEWLQGRIGDIRKVPRTGIAAVNSDTVVKKYLDYLEKLDPEAAQALK